MNNAFEKHKQNVTSRPDPIQPNPCGLVFRAVMGWVKDFSPKKVKGSVCFFAQLVKGSVGKWKKEAFMYNKQSIFYNLSGRFILRLFSFLSVTKQKNAPQT